MVLALICFAFFVATGGIIGNKYNQLGNLAKVLTLIRTHYIEEMNTSTLVDGATRGMVDALGDPYSVYLDAEAFKQLMEETTDGSFGGLGLWVEVKDDFLTVVQVNENMPAHGAGLRVGDHIIEIDGRDV